MERIAYNAKGQRTLIAYGNGVMTRYAYDPKDLPPRTDAHRALHQADALTYRPSGAALQDFGYAYDLAGNLLTLRDRTPGSGCSDQARTPWTVSSPTIRSTGCSRPQAASATLHRLRRGTTGRAAPTSPGHKPIRRGTSTIQPAT